MPPPLPLRVFVRLALRLMPRPIARRWILKEQAKYRQILGQIPEPAWSESVTVPEMAGVDEDMRAWSLLAICEHNAIVHHIIIALIRELVTGEPAPKRDPKKDVMPAADLDASAIDRFHDSIAAFLLETDTLGSLRGTPAKQHPVFGPFNAHQWFGMFAFHLMLHRKQAATVAEILRKDQPAAPA